VEYLCCGFPFMVLAPWLLRLLNRGRYELWVELAIAAGLGGVVSSGPGLFLVSIDEPLREAIEIPTLLPLPLALWGGMFASVALCTLAFRLRLEPVPEPVPEPIPDPVPVEAER